MEIQGRTLGGRYEIVELIGRGGTADTYRAIDTRLGREVALKVLLDRSDDATQRLLLDAQAVASLDHPKIVATYDVGEDAGHAYVVMELVRGRTLSELEGGALTHKQAIGYLTDVLEALDYAHARGIIHRDVKPSNVMTVGDGEVVKLTDFGLARRSTEVTRTTRTGQIVGTIAYLAPERFLSKPADIRSDLYSVGVVMYEIFTGTVPFRNDRDDIVATMFSHVHDLPSPAREINRAIPEFLERVMMRAIEKDPLRRYQTAREFIADLHVLQAPPSHHTHLVGEPRTPRSVVHRDQPSPATDPSLRQALDRALVPTHDRSDALEAALRGMMATRRRRYDEAKDAFAAALHELSTIGNDIEYAKTALKYGTMLLQKASDGMRDRAELRDGIDRLGEALRAFEDHALHEQYAEAEYLINALERTAIGLH